MTPYPEYKDSSVEWLGEIPSHWKMQRLKHLASVVFSNVDKHTFEDEDPVHLCNYTDVYHNDYITPELEFMKATASPDEIKRFTLKKGDVIVTKDSETWDDIAVPAYVASELDGILCGYHLALVRPDPSVIAGEYLFRMFSASEINDQFKVVANGVTRYGLGKYWLDNALFPLPPLPEQRTIAAYLDRETARLDATIAESQHLIDLLRERRAALIAHTVTHGLNPTAPLKDSGIEWLGEIPAHWEAKKIKWLAIVKRGASPRPIDDPIYFDDEGEYAWVRISDVTASLKYLLQTEQTLSELGKSKSVSLEPGEIFLSIAGSVGKPIITKIKCCIHDGFVYFLGLKESREYLFYLFSGDALYQGLGKMGTQLNLNTDTIGDIYIPVPPLPEQRAIAAYLDRETARLDHAIAEAETLIAHLEEYRAALIAAAVTGKIDVRQAIVST